MKIDYKKSALLIIDVQNDFCPGGALAVPDGDEVLAPLNQAAQSFAQHNAPVIVTQDWHPPAHCSFINSGGQWPEHCVQGSDGAALHTTLDTKAATLILRKGYRPSLDSYSAFFENDRKTATGLAGFLHTLGITSVYIGGLAADYCVLYSALDAAALGFTTFVARNAVRAVNIPEGSAEKAFIIMKDKGIQLIDRIV